jgi:hypothetical protein
MATAVGLRFWKNLGVLERRTSERLSFSQITTHFLPRSWQKPTAFCVHQPGNEALKASGNVR